MSLNSEPMSSGSQDPSLNLMRENKAGEGLACRYVVILSESNCVVSIKY